MGNVHALGARHHRGTASTHGRERTRECAYGPRAQRTGRGSALGIGAAAGWRQNEPGADGRGAHPSSAQARGSSFSALHIMNALFSAAHPFRMFLWHAVRFRCVGRLRTRWVAGSARERAAWERREDRAKRQRGGAFRQLVLALRGVGAKQRSVRAD